MKVTRERPTVRRAPAVACAVTAAGQVTDVGNADARDPGRADADLPDDLPLAPSAGG